jgi:tetratricopeptide (TPR) repeat protein
MALLWGVGLRRKGELGGGMRQAESPPPPPVQQSENLAQSTAFAPSAERPSSTSGAEIGSAEQKKPGLEPPAPPVKPPSARSEPASAAAESWQPTAEELLKEEMEVARQLVKEFPAEASALALLGDVYMRQGNAVEAVKCWEGCVKLNPKVAMAYNRLGTSALKRGEYEEAVRLWRKAVEIDPAMSGVHGGLGRALLYLGKPQEALMELQQEVRISPQESLEYFLLGQAYLQLNDYEKARKNYEKAAQLQPDASRTYYGLANACEKLGESDKAKEYREKFQKLLAEESDASHRDLDRCADLASLRERVVVSHIIAGQIYRQSGGLKKAEEAFRKVIQLAPRRCDGYRELAMLYLNAGRKLDEARSLAQAAVRLEPSAANFRLLGEACDRNSDRQGALSAMERAIALEPGNDQYRRIYGWLKQRK